MEKKWIWETEVSAWEEEEEEEMEEEREEVVPWRARVRINGFDNLNTNGSPRIREIVFTFTLFSRIGAN